MAKIVNTQTDMKVSQEKWDKIFPPKEVPKNCPHCEGAGEVYGTECSDCNGWGTFE